MKKELLYLNWISKSYDNNSILKYVNLTVFENEIFAIVGRNAVGKSTLLKLISGYTEPDNGTMYLHEERVNLRTHFDALALGISFIQSSIEIIPEMSVYENVYLGLKETRNSGLLYSKKRALRKITKVINDLQLSISPLKPGGELTALEKYYIEILRAVLNGSCLLLIDEPFSALNSTESVILKNLLIKLKQQGISIIFTSHKVIDLCELADRICILKNGKSSVIFENHYTYPELHRRLVSLLSTNSTVSLPPVVNHPGKEVLRVEHFSVPPFVYDLSFTLYQHEILGITGLDSQALNCLLDALWGLKPHTHGHVYLSGKMITSDTPKQALKHRIAYLSDIDSGHTQIIHSMSVLNNLTLPYLERMFPHSLINAKMENYIAEHVSTFFPFHKSEWKNKAQNLSYGLEKKLALARWFSMKHKVLILNEPLKGLDLDNHAQVAAHMQRLAREGTPVIMKSMDFDDISECTTRTLVIENGYLQGELKGSAITVDNILSLALKNNRGETHV